jgi:hypothetical protein
VTRYVWSGSLRGVASSAETPRDAVVEAVRGNLPCVLGPAIRVSRLPRGLDEEDEYFEPPYEAQFPELFNGELEVVVNYVETS